MTLESKSFYQHINFENNQGFFIFRNRKGQGFNILNLSDSKKLTGANSKDLVGTWDLGAPLDYANNSDVIFYQDPKQKELLNEKNHLLTFNNNGIM